MQPLVAVPWRSAAMGRCAGIRIKECKTEANENPDSSFAMDPEPEVSIRGRRTGKHMHGLVATPRVCLIDHEDHPPIALRDFLHLGVRHFT